MVVSLQYILNNLSIDDLTSGKQIESSSLNLRCPNTGNKLSTSTIEQLFIEAGYLVLIPSSDIIIPVCPIQLDISRRKKRGFTLLIKDEYINRVIGYQGKKILALNDTYNAKFNIKEYLIEKE